MEIEFWTNFLVLNLDKIKIFIQTYTRLDTNSMKMLSFCLTNGWFRATRKAMIDIQVGFDFVFVHPS